MSFKVTLDDADYKLAHAEAMRQIERKQQFQRNSDHGGVSKRDLTSRIVDTRRGLLGEIAAAKYLQREWTPGGVKVKRGDVDDKIEVRTTHHANGNLLIYESDADTAWFILMVGTFPNYRVAGAIKASEGKRKGVWRDDADPPCYWVEQAQLLGPERFQRNQQPAAKPAPPPALLHYCHCGAWGSFGRKVKLRADQLGEWFCSQHWLELSTKK